MTRRTKLSRALGLDGNPLRRRADRLGIGLALGLSALFLICAPLLAVLAGRWTYEAGLAQQRSEGHWRQVVAVTLQAAPASADQYVAQWADIGVLARWVTPSGVQRVGEVSAWPGIRAGTSVRVWLNGSGWPSAPPLSARQLRTRVVGVVALVPTVLAVALLIIAWLARWLLTRSKLAAWESDWALVEPQWSRQQR
jgi:hypothetical protein